MSRCIFLQLVILADLFQEKNSETLVCKHCIKQKRYSQSFLIKQTLQLGHHFPQISIQFSMIYNKDFRNFHRLS